MRLSQLHQVSLLSLSSLLILRLGHGHEFLGVRLLINDFQEVPLLTILDESSIVRPYEASKLAQHLVDYLESNFNVLNAVSAKCAALIVKQVCEVLAVLDVFFGFDHLQKSKLVATFNQTPVLLGKDRPGKDKVVR